jgi:DNA-binding beta-propeller fold protein YncE
MAARRVARRLRGLALAVGLALAARPAGAAGPLAWLEVHRDGVAGADGLAAPRSAVVSPDGRHVYVASLGETSLAVFARDPGDGTLAFVGTHDVGGAQAAPIWVAVSPDGAHVYVAVGFASGGSVIRVFARNAVDGTLAFVGNATAGAGIYRLDLVMVSTDGNQVYAIRNAFADQRIARFARNPAGGALTFIDSVEVGSSAFFPASLVSSPDGGHLYAASANLGAVAVFARDATTGALAAVQTVSSVFQARGGAAVSADGAHVYVAQVDFMGHDRVETFERDPASGMLTPVGLVEEDVDGVDDLSRPGGIATSPDGESVYVAGLGNALRDTEGTVAVFGRNAASGALTFREFHADGVNGDDGIDQFPGTGFSVGLALSPDGANVYVPGGEENALAVFRRVTLACSATPAAGCRRPVVGNEGTVTIVDAADDARDRFVWKWARGEETSLADFGDPLATPADQVFCVYDASAGPQPVLASGAVAGRFCEEKPCWKAGETKFALRETDFTPHGLRAVVLRAGGDAQAKIVARGKGRRLVLPALPLAVPVIVQMQAADGRCWEAVYGAPSHNDAERFKARADP